MAHRFLFLLFVFVVLAGPMQARAVDPVSHRFSVAVIIGNKSYQGRIPEVAYAHRDADAMRAYLTEVLGYREGNIIDLRDATKSQMESAFGNRASHRGEIWGYIRPGRSHVTVFYSGHGVPGLQDKRGYLLPVDANPDTPEINGYPVDVLYENLSKLDVKSVTVYLDACFSGESERGMLIRSASPVFVQASMPETSSSMTVLTAASAEQVASWDEENQHGLFTWHLLQALQGAADEEPFGNGDGTVTVAETQAYLDDEMSYAARRRFRRIQTASVQGAGDTPLGVVPDMPVAAPARETPQVAARVPAAEIEDRDETMVVTGNRVNVRSGPGTDFEKIATISGGTEVEVTGKVPGKNWFRIAMADGGAGYVFGKLLGDAVPAAETPAVGSFPVEPDPAGGFKDCDLCPELVIVPAGAFQMGTSSYEKNRGDDEGPVHRVAIPKAFAIGKFEVTKAEFAAFADTTGYSTGTACRTRENDSWDVRENRTWRDPGYRQSPRDPVVCVNKADAAAYLEWLSRMTGKRYRLPTEAEWEYAARAGTLTARFWSDDPDEACGFANVHDKTAKRALNTTWTAHACEDGAVHTTAVGRYAPNAFGLHDTLGSVWEWTADCYTDSYDGAPSDGSARLDGACEKGIDRGGSWISSLGYVRTGNRAGPSQDLREFTLGMRVARDLD